VSDGCQYCGKVAIRGHCNATDGQLACSRPTGHDGPHVACAPPDHKLSVWSDDLAEVVEA